MDQKQDTPPNSALDVKLDFIQRDLKELKTDVKEFRAEIKNDYVSRREFNDALVALREENRVTLDKAVETRKIINWILAAFGLAMISAIAKLILKI